MPVVFPMVLLSVKLYPNNHEWTYVVIDRSSPIGEKLSGIDLEIKCQQVRLSEASIGQLPLSLHFELQAYDKFSPPSLSVVRPRFSVPYSLVTHFSFTIFRHISTLLLFHSASGVLVFALDIVQASRNG